jgi:hypothetical protein
MQETRTSAPTRDTEERLATRRRAKRGLIAGYIHEISGRRAAPALVGAHRRAAEPAAEPARGG